tara:strand:+ start:7175 stop:7711 length:537 start_codon:yes stop_codon:yes gene_type:complete
MSWNFKSLNLAHVTADGPPRTSEGDYICTITGAEIKEYNGCRTAVVVSFKTDNGFAFKEFCTMHNTKKDDKSQNGVEIGRKRLKSILEHGGHPNPDNPEDISTLKGLEVGVRLRLPKDSEGNVERWGNDADGWKQSGVKPMPFGAYYSPDDMETVIASTPVSNGHDTSQSEIDDEIPF